VSRLRTLVREVLFGPEPAARLVFVHRAFALLIGVRVVLGPYRQLAGQPEALFDPVPILSLLSGMPPTGVFVALQVAGGAAAALAVARRRPRAAFAVAWVCYLVLAGLRGSRGKVLHNDLLLLWSAAPLVFARVPARDDPVEQGPRRAWGWPVRTSMAIAALVYFFAGVWKLRRSGPAWAYGDNMRYILIWGPSAADGRWDALAEWIVESAVAYRAAAASLLGLELAFPVALLVRRLQPVFGVVAAAMHVLTYLVLGLDYWAWAGVVLAQFVDWPALARRAGMRVTPARAGYDGLP
jgi:hypothetical protein